MSGENMGKEINIDGQKITLADLTGVNLDDVKEMRGLNFPKMVGIFEVDDEKPPHATVIGEGDNAKAAIVFRAKCLEVITIDHNDPLSQKDYEGDGSDLIGKCHQETFFLTTLEGLGYVKAFFKDIGAPYNSNMNDLLAGSVGTRFQAPIGKRKDKNDADKIYTNIVRNKIKPLAGAAVSEVAKAVA